MGDAGVRVASFIGENCQGNLHQVFLKDFFVANDSLLAGNQSQDIVVFYRTRPDTANSDESLALDLKCFFNEREINFCGSACLAIAMLIKTKEPFIETLKLFLADREVNISFREKLIYLSLASFDIRQVFETAYWEALVGKRILCLSQSGGEFGYIVAELESALDVADASPDLERMKSLGGPSLILTARAKPAYEEDYVMRYFAPQYGNPEDEATGSANALLIQYWFSRFERSTLKGRQLSRQGGLFCGEFENDVVKLGGLAEIL